MPCRIGITTRPEERQAYWQSQVVGFANWQILNTFRSKAAAREYQGSYALRNGCEQVPDDIHVSRTSRTYEEQYDWWYVYHFDHTPETA